MSAIPQDHARGPVPPAAVPRQGRATPRGTVDPAASHQAPPVSILPAAVSPALVVLSILVAAYVALFLAAAVGQVPVRLVDYRFLGLDFNDFWTAAGDVLAGRDPYARARFVTPPLSSLPFLPLALLPRETATVVYLCFNCAALVLGTGWLIKAFGLPRPRAVQVALACGLSSATLFLIERGNLDGLVFLMLCAFMASGARTVFGSVALAIASCLKIYPALFGLVLVADRRWRASLVLVVVVLTALVLTPSGDLSFLHNQAVRAHGMRVDENLSGLSLFWLLDSALFDDPAGASQIHPSMAVGAALYAAALGFCLWRDARRARHAPPTRHDGSPDRRLLLASYVAFCVSIPPLVYLYSGVCLFVLLVALEQEGLSIGGARLRGIAVALGLAMLPAKSVALTIDASWAGALNLLPPLGTLLLVVEAVRLRLGPAA